MQVREYIFRSPYPQRVQVGTPDNTMQNSQNSTEDPTKMQQKETQTDVVKSQTKSITGNEKLTPEVNSLNLYA